MFLSNILVVTHNGSSSALTLSAGQAAARVPGAGGACGVGETHNLEQAANKISTPFVHTFPLDLISSTHTFSWFLRIGRKFFDPKNSRGTLNHCIYYLHSLKPKPTLKTPFFLTSCSTHLNNFSALVSFPDPCIDVIMAVSTTKWIIL